METAIDLCLPRILFIDDKNSKNIKDESTEVKVVVVVVKVAFEEVATFVAAASIADSITGIYSDNEQIL